MTATAEPKPDLEALAQTAGIVLPPLASKRAKATPASKLAEDALLAAIKKAPESEAAWQAYATWLCAQGDPLGRTLLVGRAARACKIAEAALIAKHRDELVGVLGTWIDRGWLDVTWHDGYLKYVDISVDEALGVTEQQVVDTLFDHPSGARLAELRLSGFDVRANGQQPLLDAVIERRPATLRELEVSGVFGMSCGDVSRVWAAFPKLESLTVFGSDVEFGEIDAPELKRLEVHVGDLTPAVLDRITSARTPKLETIRISGLHAKEHAAAIAKILDGTTFPALKTLLLRDVRGTRGGDAIAQAVLDSPLKLATLAMWDTTVGKPMLAKLQKRFGAELLR